MSDAEILTLKKRVANLTVVLTDCYNRLGLPAPREVTQCVRTPINELDNNLIHLLGLAKNIFNEIDRL